MPPSKSVTLLRKHQAKYAGAKSAKGVSDGLIEEASTHIGKGVAAKALALRKALQLKDAARVQKCKAALAASMQKKIDVAARAKQKEPKRVTSVRRRKAAQAGGADKDEEPPANGRIEDRSYRALAAAAQHVPGAARAALALTAKFGVAGRRVEAVPIPADAVKAIETGIKRSVHHFLPLPTLLAFVERFGGFVAGSILMYGLWANRANGANDIDIWIPNGAARMEEIKAAMLQLGLAAGRVYETPISAVGRASEYARLSSIATHALSLQLRTRHEHDYANYNHARANDPFFWDNQRLRIQCILLKGEERITPQFVVDSFDITAAALWMTPVDGGRRMAFQQLKDNTLHPQTAVEQLQQGMTFISMTAAAMQSSALEWARTLRRVIKYANRGVVLARDNSNGPGLQYAMSQLKKHVDTLRTQSISAAQDEARQAAARALHRINKFIIVWNIEVGKMANPVFPLMYGSEQQGLESKLGADGLVVLGTDVAVKGRAAAVARAHRRIHDPEYVRWIQRVYKRGPESLAQNRERQARAQAAVLQQPQAPPAPTYEPLNLPSVEQPSAVMSALARAAHRVPNLTTSEMQEMMQNDQLEAFLANRREGVIAEGLATHLRELRELFNQAAARLPRGAPAGADPGVAQVLNAQRARAEDERDEARRHLIAALMVRGHSRAEAAGVVARMDQTNSRRGLGRRGVARALVFEGDD